MEKINQWPSRFVVLAVLLTLVFAFGTAPAQAQGDFAAERDQAIRLINAGNFAEALPLLEKLSAAKEADGDIFMGLGLAYWRLQDTAKTKAELKQFRLKARNAWLRARDLGSSVPEIDLIVRTIKADGGSTDESDDPKAQEAYNQAGEAFVKGDMQTAVVEYERAATLDPTWYEAALYTGNTYYRMKEYEKAGVWFAKAIAIDPNRETAYRYWADGLSFSGREKEAVDKYLDAIVAEPYNSAAWRGLIQYAQRSGVKLAHPKIDVPVEFSASGEGNTKITLGNVLGGKDDDGSFAWTMYGISRALWQTGKDGKLSKEFSQAHPNEKVYRHSLAEEAAALRTVLAVLKENKKVKKPAPSLALLKKVSDEGLLEAFILFARADAGVKQDYAAYRQTNREKLKRYLADYVMKNGGN